ncbi:Polyketide synthase PksM [Paenibacillus nuruki]|uniref:Polyketide synthase PksM n=1 Tax=Paenibacillus nuruki TaxID=1886670 RepID=A0A1E3L3V0_9BACL|nr:type I polyketide synthase [Paenibacillus nuruki]ODP28426.1 Polyketide synthase PksM [Paenibacillus nuruki]
MSDNEQLYNQQQQLDELNRWLVQLLYVQMQKIGYTADMPISELLDLLPKTNQMYMKWLQQTTTVLTQYSVPLINTDELWRNWADYKEKWLQDSNMRAKIILAETMLLSLPDILHGHKPATDLMFSHASMDLVEGIYKNNNIADHFNHIVADQVIAQIEHMDQTIPSKSLRILEIGAGTGGTSALLFSRLQPYTQYIAEYAYTDISKSFLNHARKHYGIHYDYLTYHLLNIEESMLNQQIDIGGYDIVVATNVLHATRDIRLTLRNAKALLKKDGMMIINEIIEYSLFNHVTFGLLQGWWLYEDPILRIPGCPLLTPAQWRNVLEQEGYQHIAYPTVETEFLGQQVITALSDGVIRQKKENNAPKDNHQNEIIEQSKSIEDISNKVIAKPMVPHQTEELLKQKSMDHFKIVIGQILEVEPDSIDVSEELEMYGMDSILIIQLTDELNKVMEEHVSSVLFFEYSTIATLVDYFITHRYEALITMLGEKVDVIEPVIQPSSVVPTEPLLESETITSPESKDSIKPDIAIIGLAGRYAQTDDMTEFWNQLQEGKSAITEIPADRWEWQQHYHPEKGQTGFSYSKWGGFIKGIDTFDPLFFYISPKEAEQMDPQERQFLQIAYSCIEDAGYIPQQLSHSQKVGVFVGVMNGNYPTGSSYWSIANRVSYSFNFVGPSLAVDTACSSSLTAIHLALDSLYSGTSECAIAGGVNLIVDPVHYERLCDKNMLSSGEQCRSFGESADGFVDGEGVGAIVLKPLHQAIQDGDHIYGVIKGSMINAGGKTKGYTVPNPALQSKVVADAIQTSGIDARMISYIEAHGTGTALGDPIEIEGLRRAFEQDTTDTQFCAIGSIKSNIGHCESAAGIAGLSKILLQLQHHQLVPSLHSERLNPNIKFEQTPFHVQQQLTTWNRPQIEVNGRQEEIPRIAGISSFGAGGANAHLVVAEYIPTSVQRPVYVSQDSNSPVAILLSARTEERLQVVTKRLLQQLERSSLDENQLSNIAYTLQVGREAMEFRLAILVSSIDELKQHIKQSLDPIDTSTNVYKGDATNSKSIKAQWSDEDMQATLTSWIRKRKYPQLLELWVQGVDINWSLAYNDNETRPQRMSLPVYPFAKEKYWYKPAETVSSIDTPLQFQSDTKAELLHPLLHHNDSRLQEQKFTSIFSGKEFFLEHHQVQGIAVLPGAAHLEMALQAVKHSMPLSRGSNTELPLSFALTHIVWANPISIEHAPKSVHINLQLEHVEEISYEIYSEQDQQEWRLCSQGRATFDIALQKEVIDIQSIQQDCQLKQWSAAECYRAFTAMGLSYGVAHQTIQHVSLGSNQLIAKLSLPDVFKNTIQPYILHPALLDGALQASIGLTTGFDTSMSVPSLPFALQRLEVVENCDPEMWVHIQYSAGSHSHDPMPRLDINICNQQGTVCIRLKEFVTRRMQSDHTTEQPYTSTDTRATSNTATMMFTPVWEMLDSIPTTDLSESIETVVYIHNQSSMSEMWSQYIPNINIVSLDPNQSIDGINNQLSIFKEIDHIIWSASSESMPYASEQQSITFQEKEVLLFFRFVKSLLALGYGSRSLHVTVLTYQAQSIHPFDAINPAQAALHGYIGSLAKEYSHWHIRLVDMEIGADIPIESILSLAPDPQGDAYLFREHEWYRQELLAVEYEQNTTSTIYRQGGVYVIIGGSGGIGEVWSEYMIRKYNAHVIWIGRKEKNQQIQAQLDRLARWGPQPLYISGDATDINQLQLAYQQIKQHYNRIDGVIHSALVLSDRSLANMDEQQFCKGLAPKLNISVNMAQVFAKESLDFVLFFSSLNSFMKLPGQSNYVAGCTYMDAFARQLSQSFSCAVKVMNWGYWGNVGSVVSPEVQQSMANKGIGSIEPPEANQALELLLTNTLDQLVMIETIGQPELPLWNNNKTIMVYQ